MNLLKAHFYINVNTDEGNFIKNGTFNISVFDATKKFGFAPNYTELGTVLI
ncbi:MAG: hypothetical protein J1F35_00170 [Erysipelotrichales bacterium]|nr:hypothetical protein [Erysipelotrichales bacterium]